MLKLDALQQTPVSPQPYPYLVVPQIIEEEYLPQLVAGFPDITHPGSIPVAEANGGPLFHALIEELEGDTMRQTIAEKFQLDLNGLPVFTTLRGVMRAKDGAIHRDSKTKIITLLLYFNEAWEQPGGRLRILRSDSNLDDYADEITPVAGRMLLFKVTDNCWHGHIPVEGKRFSIQLNYLVGKAAKGKHQFFHSLSAKLKKRLGAV
ncbi:MAG: 2OG-Fe(II) oxygenase family protein [Pseudomonadales bacterium]